MVTREQLRQLKQPLPYQWKVQTSSEHGAGCVAYIDARDVQNCLDEYIGPENWQNEYREVKGVVYCGLAIRVLRSDDTTTAIIHGEWVWKWDAGTESQTEKQKGEASDAFKRAAVKWGVGRFLYDLPIVRLKTQQGKNGKWLPVDTRSNKVITTGEWLTEFINATQKGALVTAATAIPANQWEKAVAECKTVAELVALYDANKGIVDASPALQDIFSKRRTVLKTAQP